MPPVMLIFLILVLGLAVYVKLAFSVRKDASNKSLVSGHLKHSADRIENFFLGGRNVGVGMYEQTTWGTSFAFGNSIFYAIFLGFNIGLLAIPVQATWCLGFVALSFLLPRIVEHTGRFTLHGFLGHMFGKEARYAASLASMTGFILNVGFEVVFGAAFIAQLLGMEEYKGVFSVLIGVFAATYCSIGGYRANIKTDALSNRLSVVAMILLLVLLFASGRVDNAATSGSAMLSSLFDFTQVPLSYVIGIAIFSIVYQIVDMVNWQNISANSLSANTEEGIKNLQHALRRSAFRILLIPVTLGSFIGYFLRGGEGIGESNIMIKLVSAVSPGVANILPTVSLDLLSTALVGFVAFAFMGATFSGADSWLMATVQSLSWDILDYKKFKDKSFDANKILEPEQQEITRKAKRLLFPIAAFGAFAFYELSEYWGEIFAFQFIMFGAALSMAPALGYALYLHGKDITNVAPIVGRICFLSIVCGYASAVLVFALSVLEVVEIDTYTYGPMAALAGGTLLVLVSDFVRRRTLAKEDY